MKGVGYSGKSLVQKLGYTPKDTVMTVQEPEWFRLLLKHEGIEDVKRLPADWLHLFVMDRHELDSLIEAIDLTHIKIGFWVSWPKRTSKLSKSSGSAKKKGTAARISEQDLRDLILPLGWVDTKVCAVDADWSGLKFLRRKN